MTRVSEQGGEDSDAVPLFLTLKDQFVVEKNFTGKVCYLGFSFTFTFWTRLENEAAATHNLQAVFSSLGCFPVGNKSLT